MPYRETATRELAWKRLLDGAIRAEARLARAQRREEIGFRLAFVVVAAAIAAAFFAPLGRAQDCPERSDALILGILTVHEAGWYAEGDMRSIHAALVAQARARGTTFAEAACEHSRRLLTGRTSRPWASDLDELGTEPARWPTTVLRCEAGTCEVREHLPWSHFVERWRSVLELAREVVAGPPACSDVVTWGGRIDFDPERRRRPVPEGRTWVDVACVDVETRNRFGFWRRTEGP